MGPLYVCCLPYFPLSQCKPFVRSTLLQLVWTFRLKFISYAIFGSVDSPTLMILKRLCVLPKSFGESVCKSVNPTTIARLTEAALTLHTRKSQQICKICSGAVLCAHSNWAMSLFMGQCNKIWTLLDFITRRYHHWV